MQPKLFTWDAASNVSVAALQTLAGADTVLLNGTLAPTNNLGNFPVVFTDYVRKITLTSVNNLSAVNFTITGTTNGLASTEVLAGPNANTVASVNNYDSIISIRSSGAAAAFSVGTGQTGYTRWLLMDFNKMAFNYNVITAITGVINYTFQDLIADDPANPSFGLTSQPFVNMTGATTDQVASSTFPCTHTRILINSSTAGATLFENIIQQGIR